LKVHVLQLIKALHCGSAQSATLYVLPSLRFSIFYSLEHFLKKTAEPIIAKLEHKMYT